MGEEGIGPCILPDALLMIFKSLCALKAPNNLQAAAANILINLHVAIKESQMERFLASVSLI